MVDDIPVGTWVRAWPGARNVPHLVRRTRTPVWELGNGTPVVSVEGISGGIALDHIEIIPNENDRCPGCEHCNDTCGCGCTLTIGHRIDKKP